MHAGADRSVYAAELKSTDPAKPPRRSFTGRVFRNHFERLDTNPVSLGAAVLKITTVVHHRKFAADAEPLPDLEYLLFGKGQELFLAHLITMAPDFDHVLGVTKVDGHRLPDEALGSGLAVKFPDRPNEASQRLRPREEASGTIEIAGKAIPVRVKTGVELYFEEGELSS